MTTTYVVAGTFTMFRAWCLDNDVHERDPQYRYVDNAQALRGVSTGKIVFAYGSDGLRDIDEIVARAEWINHWRDGGTP